MGKHAFAGRNTQQFITWRSCEWKLFIFFSWFRSGNHLRRALYTSLTKWLSGWLGWKWPYDACSISCVKLPYMLWYFGTFLTTLWCWGKFELINSAADIQSSSWRCHQLSFRTTCPNFEPKFSDHISDCRSPTWPRRSACRRTWTACSAHWCCSRWATPPWIDLRFEQLLFCPQYSSQSGGYKQSSWFSLGLRV